MRRVEVAQTGTQGNAAFTPVRGSALFRLTLGFALVAFLLIGTFQGAEWYAGQVSLPRYCDNPEATIGLVHQILTERQPASEESRRPYIIAAKLIYLIPQSDGEALEAYLARLRFRIAESCR